MTARPLVLVFCKYPCPGAVKTRLASGPEGLGVPRATALYRAFVRDVLDAVHNAGARALVCTAPGADAGRYAAWLGLDSGALRSQSGADLGARMHNALAGAFAEGAERALLIGTDLPHLPPEVLREAWRLLARKELVLGPALDGGYYLVGLRRDYPRAHRLFAGVPWSTGRVLAATLARSGRPEKTGLLPRLRDVDTPADLRAVLAATRGTALARATRRCWASFQLPEG